MPNKISVVMVIYNQREFVAAAIRSIFRQDYSNAFEFVISDDASTDDSPAIISEVVKEAPPHVTVRVIFGQVRKGAFRNFSRALRIASGEFVVVADGDDVSLPHRISEGVNCLIESGVSACGSSRLSSQDFGMTKGGRFDVDRTRFCLSENSPINLEKRVPNIVGASFVFCRSILINFQKIDSVLVNNHNADQAIFWRAVASRGYRDLPSVSVLYNTSSGGVTLRRKEENFRAQHAWLNTLDIHWRRVFNKIGNKLAASDVFSQAGFFDHAHTARVAAREIAIGLSGLLKQMISAGVWLYCPELFSKEKIDYVLSKERWCLSFFDDVISNPKKITSEVAAPDLVIFFAQLAELGVVSLFTPSYNFLAIPDDRKFKKIAFLRVLSAIRLNALQSPGDSVALSEIALSSIRKLVTPFLKNGMIYYRGAARVFNWANFRALPRVDFTYLAYSLIGIDPATIGKCNMPLGCGKSEILVRVLGVRRLIGFRGLSISDRTLIVLSAAKFKIFRFLRERSLL